MNKKILLVSAVAVLAVMQAKAQTKIGDDPTTINSSAILELSSSNKALLVPRLPLLSTTDIVTVPDPIKGMIVFNTNQNLTGTADFPAGGRGLYYYKGIGFGWVFVGATTAGSGLTQNGTKVDLGGPLAGNAVVTGNAFTSTFSSTQSANEVAALNAVANPGNAIPAGNNVYASKNIISGNSTGAATTTLRAQYNSASSASNNTRVFGSLNEAAAGGQGLGTGNTPQATGTTGLADYTGTGAATADDYLVGVRGATFSSAKTGNVINALNMVGVTFDGSFQKSVGGYFYPTKGATNLGTVSQVGGDENQAWKDPAFTNNTAVAAVDYTGTGHAIQSVGKVQLANLNGTTANTAGVISTNIQGDLSVSTANSLVTVSNGISKDATSGDVQLGGALNKATAITATGANNLVVNASGVGSGTSDQNQGFTVIATAATASAKTNRAIGIRSSLEVPTGTTVVEARGSSTTANVTGTVNATATGAYMNTILRSGSSVASGRTVTGASGDVEVQSGATNLDNTRTLTGARFGSDATNGAEARTTGVTATAVNSTSSNIGMAASANTTEADLKSHIATTVPLGTSAATYSYAPAGATNFANYSDGNVRMQNLPKIATADTVLSSDVNGNVNRVPASSLSNNIKANNGLIRNADSVQLGGALTKATDIALNGNNFSISNATNATALFRNDGSIALGNSVPVYSDNKLEINLKNVGGATTNGEQNQGVNILASALSGSALSVGMRGRMNVNASTSVGGVRGIQGNVGIDGGLTGAATAGYFNAVVRSGATIGSTSNITGVGADAEAGTGSPVGTNTNAFIGGRFGSDASKANGANTYGVFTTAAGSVGTTANPTANTGVFALSTGTANTNVGVLAAVNTTIANANGAGAGKNAALVAFNPAGASSSTVTTKDLAILSSGGVQMTNLGTTTAMNLVGIDATGNLSKTALPAAVTANNGLTKTGDNVQLGGALTMPTAISTDATNNLVINATGIGGSNVETNQGLNVLATSVNSGTAKAVALRGRVSQTTGSIGQARGVSGAANITGGNVAGTATGGYFNTYVAGATVATDGLVTGVAADAEAGANAGITTATNNTFAGARFGADVAGTPDAHSAGVVATAVGSTASNVGIAASATTDAAALTTAVNALPAGSSAAIYSLNPLAATISGAATNNNAIVSDGGVKMTNLGTTLPTKLVAIDNAGNVSTTTIPTSTTLAGSGLTANAVTQKIDLGGPLTGNANLTGAFNLTVSDAAAKVGVGTATPNNKVEVVANASGTDYTTGQALSVNATATAGTSSNAIVARVSSAVV